MDGDPLGRGDRDGQLWGQWWECKGLTGWTPPHRCLQACLFRVACDVWLRHRRWSSPALGQTGLVPQGVGFYLVPPGLAQVEVCRVTSL